MIVRITAAAAELVTALTKSVEAQRGENFVPVVMWKIAESDRENFDPELTVGFVEREKVDSSRSMACDGKKVAIYQYLPDEVFPSARDCYIDKTGDKLTLIGAGPEVRPEKDAPKPAKRRRSRKPDSPDRDEQDCGE